MSSSVPVIRQIAWLSLVPQIAILFTLFWVFRSMGIGSPIFWGTAANLMIYFSLQFGIPVNQRRGVFLMKRERFAEAVPHFLKSYEFFSRHKWLDSLRAITMFSSSRISYREMALLNLAFCLVQSGERQRAIQEYKRVLVEFPGSKIAEAALRFMEPA
jgi:hypothetical protein